MIHASRCGQECGEIVATASPMPRLSGRCPDAMTSSHSWLLSSVPGTHHLQFNHYRKLMDQKVTKHRLLCIVCPEGCEMDIDEQDGNLVFPKGICRRGQEYARQEIYNPCRVLTTTVPIRGGEIPMLPVRSSQAIPMAKLIEAMQQIANIEGNAPVKTGDVICQDIAHTGITLIACRTILNSRTWVARNK
ncbi:protein of hypothetical function DUF1667 [Candidatus Vecturithrix granuli]|uniref:Protein of hypothetical function DUF1667 n=1 Tax=Vecturithrix granuli TaxID=1499967 RepID=A0A0S6WBL0_VECG1|nr:protein of hypothetical function DUF1667 [Candidatus Vecturithrix granuli]